MKSSKKEEEKKEDLVVVVKVFCDPLRKCYVWSMAVPP